MKKSLEGADPQAAEEAAEEAADVVILGGGVAGLWLLHRLSQAGYGCRLIDRGPCGEGQTLQSQGILHRGTKYLLRPDAKGGFPDLWPRWQAALAGRSEIDPDLRSVRVHAPGPDLLSLAPLPTPLLERLEKARRQGLVEKRAPSRFRLLEPVLDMPDLLRALTRPYKERCMEASDVALIPDEAMTSIRVKTPTRTFVARWLILAAGAGNEDLLNGLRQREPSMVRRPLHMTWLEKISGPTLPPTWCHILDDEAAPGRPGAHFTVTSHPATSAANTLRSGATWRWYVGGDPSESGVDRDPAAQIDFILRLLRRHFPTLPARIDSTFRCWTQRVDRAEPAHGDGGRRLEPFVHRRGRILTVWPMKLTLAPRLGDQVIRTIRG